MAAVFGRTVGFVERMTEVGELAPPPGEPAILRRRRAAIDEAHRIDGKERTAI